MTDAELEQASKEWHENERKFPEIHVAVSDVVNYVAHIVKIAGIDHVGIGNDFDTGSELEYYYDVSQIKNITFELLRRGIF